MSDYENAIEISRPGLVHIKTLSKIIEKEITARKTILSLS